MSDQTVNFEGTEKTLKRNDTSKTTLKSQYIKEEEYTYEEKLGPRTWRVRCSSDNRIAIVQTGIQLSFFDHRNILKQRDNVQIDGVVHTVPEFMREGSLADAIRVRKATNEYFTETEVISFAIQLLLGLQEFHKDFYYHCRLHPDHLFLQQEREFTLFKVGPKSSQLLDGGMTADRHVAGKLIYHFCTFKHLREEDHLKMYPRDFKSNPPSFSKTQLELPSHYSQVVRELIHLLVNEYKHTTCSKVLQLDSIRTIADLMNSNMEHLKAQYVAHGDKVLWQKVNLTSSDAFGNETWNTSHYVTGKKCTMKLKVMHGSNAQQLTQELKMLLELQHPNIESVISFFPEGDKMVIISDQESGSEELITVLS